MPNTPARRLIEAQAVTVSTVEQVKTFADSSNWPENTLLEGITIKARGTITVGGGSGPVTDGEKAFVHNIDLEANGYGKIINSWDGLGAYRIAHMLGGVAPAVTAVTPATHSVTIPLDFRALSSRMRPGYRLTDTALILRKSKPKLRVTAGVLADLLGTVSTASDAAEVLARVHHRPDYSPASFAAGGDLPESMPYFTRDIKSGYSAGEVTMKISTGLGRRLRWLAFSQRVTATGAEASNEITPNSSTVTIRKGSKYFCENERWTDLAEHAARELGLASLPGSGWLFYDFTESGRIPDGVDMGDGADMEVIFNALAANSGQGIYAYQAYVQPLPADVLR